MTTHGPAIARLRAMLGTYEQGTHSVCTVRQSDLREALSLIDSMQECCEGRGEALAATFRGVVDARICAEPCARRSA
jgi:hypothetical protein